MKTQGMFTTLRELAELAEASRAEELRRFASIFSGGKDEAVAARVKRILARRRDNPVPQGYPATLKRSLVAIESGLSACGAKKQASDLQAVLSLFEGSATASVEGFVETITSVMAAPVAASPRSKREQAPDHMLASRLADELARAVLDPEAFAKVSERLRDSKLVSTPTLGAVANCFLGNKKIYKGRKAAIDDIITRQEQDARSHARSKALDRIGV